MGHLRGHGKKSNFMGFLETNLWKKRPILQGFLGKFGTNLPQKDR